MSRMCHLSDEEGTCCVADVAAHAHDKSTGKEHGIGIAWLRACLDRCPEDNKTAANCCSKATPAIIGNVRSDEKDGKPSKPRECTEQPKVRTGWVVEDYRC